MSSFTFAIAAAGVLMAVFGAGIKVGAWFCAPRDELPTRPRDIRRAQSQRAVLPRARTVRGDSREATTANMRKGRP